MYITVHKYLGALTGKRRLALFFNLGFSLLENNVAAKCDKTLFPGRLNVKARSQCFSRRQQQQDLSKWKLWPVVKIHLSRPYKGIIRWSGRRKKKQQQGGCWREWKFVKSKSVGFCRGHKNNKNAVVSGSRNSRFFRSSYVPIKQVSVAQTESGSTRHGICIIVEEG